MTRTGVIGVGDMGSGLLRNLVAAGFETAGHDIDVARCAAVAGMGGRVCASVAEVGRNADAVFVMVMTGAQAHEVILGPDGLAAHMPAGGIVLLTATIRPDEAAAIGAGLDGTGLRLIDTPVSGGYPGAQSGTLTMMAAAPPDLLAEARPVMEAVSAVIHPVGTTPGQGQTVKACLQALLGAMFSATFEAAALAAKAGVPGEVFHRVVSTSSGGCGITSNALEKIIDARFEGTGSRIDTMHKDLTISLNLAERLNVPMPTAAAAMQVFHAGRSRFPNGDNWACVRVLEEIVGAELRRSGGPA